ncbi:MAG: DUF885 domain-containing protein [Vicinamibacterales bacterium]
MSALRSRLAGAVAVVAVAVACDSVPGTRSLGNQGAGDPLITAALSRYVVEFLKRNPTTNTYLGGAGLDPALATVDGTLRDYSPAALASEDKWLAMTARELGAVNVGALTDAVSIDSQVAIAQTRFLMRQHQIRRYQERAVDTYVGEPFRAIDWQLQGLTPTGDTTQGTPAEWTLVVARVRAIPAFLKTAQVQLQAGVASGNVADRRMLERDGLDTSQANATYFSQTLPALAEARIAAGPERAALLRDLRAAGKDASTAYLSFRTFIAQTFFEADGKAIKPEYAADRYAMGAAEYDWALANNFHLDKKSAQLFDEALPIVDQTRTQMIALARQIGQQRGWALPADGTGAVRAVFDQLSKDYPKSDAEMVSWYRDAAFRLVDFSRKTGLFEVPADYRLEVVETPAPLRASVDGASYYPAPPFKQTGVGRYYVTPTGNDPAALQANNRAALADLSAHEGFPGHDWYYKLLTRERGGVSPVRWLTPGAVEDSSSMWEDSMAAEGWGLYAEALMAEPQPGAPNGFYTPEERLYQLQGQLLRDLRVQIDTGLHIGRLGYDDAVTHFSEVVDFLPGACDAAGRATSPAKRASCESADRAIFRYSKWPTQAITYRLGKDAIYDLRAEAKKRLGEKFSLTGFHLAFIRQGTIPPGYFKATLLRELAPEPAPR